MGELLKPCHRGMCDVCHCTCHNHVIYTVQPCVKTLYSCNIIYFSSEFLCDLQCSKFWYNPCFDDHWNYSTHMQMRFVVIQSLKMSSSSYPFFCPHPGSFPSALGFSHQCSNFTVVYSSKTSKFDVGRVVFFQSRPMGQIKFLS